MIENKPIHCRICAEAVCEFRGAELIVTHTPHDHAAQIDLNDIVRAAAATPEGFEALRRFYDTGFMEFAVK